MESGMKPPIRRDPNAPPDWNDMYRMGTPPWDSGAAEPELVALVENGTIKPCPVLELGCGTGADAVYLAKKRFEVTAVESSPIALERARARAEREEALLRLVLGDVFDFTKKSAPLEFIYDRGFYHSVRQKDLDRFLDMLWRITQPGSMYLVLAGNSNEKTEDGPPGVSEDEIRNELGRLFEFEHLKPFRFQSPAREDGYLGWSCLLRRPALPGK
jgi:SAM-dependent methyltransferase